MSALARRLTPTLAEQRDRELRRMVIAHGLGMHESKVKGCPWCQPPGMKGDYR